MIDTVIIRLHNLKKYERLLKLLERENRNGQTREIGTVDIEELNRIKKAGHRKAKQILHILKLNRTGEFLVKTQRGKRHHSSGHYEFSYQANLDRDYLEMNFSIPKFVHGTNVLMYVEHAGDVHHKWTENNLFDYNVKRAPMLFMAFIKHFLNFQFIDKIDLIDVEINRIDVCFSQVFKTREEALYYLEHQKKVRKKHSREEGGLPIDYGTSLMHTTKRYSAKIYHKGTEYKKNDLKHHLKINAEKGYDYFNTDKILELADRMLRYELTIRNAELNYLFKHFIFRRDCKDFKRHYKIYSKVAAILQRRDEIAKKIGTLKESEKEMYSLLNPYEDIDKKDKAIYRYVTKLLERIPSFRLETDEFSNLYNSETVISENPKDEVKCETARFTKELLSLCLKKLTDFIEEFHLMELPNEEIISIKIDQYNNVHKVKLPKAEMLKFYYLMEKSGSFKEAATISRCSKATFYRHIARFKKIGITQNSIKPEENLEFPKAPVDFKEYHDFLSNCSRSIKVKHVEYE